MAFGDNWWDQGGQQGDTQPDQNNLGEQQPAEQQNSWDQSQQTDQAVEQPAEDADPAEGQAEAAADEPVETDEVVEDDIDDPGEAETRFSEERDLSWAQTENVVNFSIAFLRSPKSTRDRLVSLINSGSHPVEVAQAIYPGGGVVESLQVFANIASKFKNGGQPGFRDGLEFQSYISEADNRSLRTFANIINSFSNDDVADIFYRSNMRMENFLDSVLDILATGISEEAREDAERISDLLKIWPTD